MSAPFIHESAYVDDGAIIGAGTKIWHFCHVMPGATIGAGCSLGQNVVVMPRTVIGDNVKIQNNVSIYEGVEIERDVFLGPSMVFTNVSTRGATSRGRTSTAERSFGAGPASAPTRRSSVERPSASTRSSGREPSSLATCRHTRS